LTLALELALVVFVISTAVATALLRDLLASIVVFAAFSLGISIIWVILQAPDVALTEAAVGAGVMSVLLLVTVAKTARTPDEAPLLSVNPKALAVVLVLVLVLVTTLPALPPVGDASAPALQEANEGGTTPYGYYIGNAYDETGVENAVTAVLVFYRGFDTFGEAVVVFSAVVGALILFGGSMRRETE
jgi:multicomponent Na+:H+ antiporter subunit B